MYRRTSKYQAQRRLGPIGGRTPRDPEDEPKPLPELRMRITVERFDFHDERHVFELKRTRRVDVFDVLVDGQPWKRCGLSRVLEGLRQALRDIADPIAAWQRDLQPGYTLDGGMCVHMANDPETYKRMAREALRA